MNTNLDKIPSNPSMPADAVNAMNALSASDNTPLKPASAEGFNVQVPDLSGGLTPEEIQVLKEMVVVRSRQKVNEFTLPEKPVNEKDIEKFEESILRRVPYAEKMILIPGKMEVVFRVKTRREKDYVNRQIDRDFKDDIIMNERDYANNLNNYNLMVQMVALNDAKVTSPVTMFDTPDFKLRNFITQHIINTMPEPMMFILTGALAQFEMRVASMSREALSRNFPKPADF